MVSNSNSRNSSAVLFGSIAAVVVVGLSTIAALKLKSNNSKTSKESKDTSNASTKPELKKINSDSPMSASITEPKAKLNGLTSNEQNSQHESLQLDPKSIQAQDEQISSNSDKDRKSVV